MSLHEEIDTAIEETASSVTAKYFKHLGGEYYVSVCGEFPCVDIRKFYKYSGQLKPTRKGVALHFAEWRNLMWGFEELCSKIPHLGMMAECSETHEKEGANCSRCYPY